MLKVQNLPTPSIISEGGVEQLLSRKSLTQLYNEDTPVLNITPSVKYAATGNFQEHRLCLTLPKLNIFTNPDDIWKAIEAKIGMGIYRAAKESVGKINVNTILAERDNTKFTLFTAYTFVMNDDFAALLAAEYDTKAGATLEEALLTPFQFENVRKGFLGQFVLTYRNGGVRVCEVQPTLKGI